MRVILSIDSLHAPLTGIGWYTLQLAKGLADHPDVESLLLTNGRQVSVPLPLTELGFAPDGSALVSGSPAHSPMGVVAGAQPPVRGLRRVASLAKSRGAGWLCRRELAKLSGHVCHGPNYTVPRRQPKARNIATIHDLSVLRYPDTHPARRVRYMRTEIPRTIANCERLIVSAPSVASELCEQFDIARDRVSVVPLAARAVFSRGTPGGSSSRDQALIRALGVPEGDFLLFVNGADPRKNFAAALAAFRLHSTSCQAAPRLVVTVPSLDDAPLTAQEAIAENVVIVPYPADEQLAALYRCADGLLYPSRYEGFGLPVVEALVAGTPVLISRADALLEFVRLPGVVSVDPLDTQAFGDGIAELRSATVSQAALTGASAVAAEFSWENCVSRTLACYALLD